MTEPRYALLLPAHIALESDEAVARLVDEGAKHVEMAVADDGPEYDDRDYLTDAEALVRLRRLVNHVQIHSFTYGYLHGAMLVVSAVAVATHFNGGRFWTALTWRSWLVSGCFILFAVAFRLLHRRKVRHWLSGLDEAGLDGAAGLDEAGL